MRDCRRVTMEKEASHGRPEDHSAAVTKTGTQADKYEQRGSRRSRAVEGGTRQRGRRHQPAAVAAKDRG